VQAGGSILRMHFYIAYKWRAVIIVLVVCGVFTILDLVPKYLERARSVEFTNLL